MLNRCYGNEITEGLKKSLETAERSFLFELPTDIVQRVRDEVTKSPYNMEGICLGMSIEFIRMLLERVSEPSKWTHEDMVHVAKNLEKGGSADANALQFIYGAVIEYNLYEFEGLQSLKSDNDRLKNLGRLLEQIAVETGFQVNSDNSVMKEGVISDYIDELLKLDDCTIRDKVKNDKDAALGCMLKSLSDRMDGVKEAVSQVKQARCDLTYGLMGRLVGARADEKAKQLDILKLDKELADLPEGVYRVEVPGHAMVYVKTTQCSYIYDPNRGLMTANSISVQSVIKRYFNKRG